MKAMSCNNASRGAEPRIRGIQQLPESYVFLIEHPLPLSTVVLVRDLLLKFLHEERNILHRINDQEWHMQSTAIIYCNAR